jgi:hypothetical protein
MQHIVDAPTAEVRGIGNLREQLAADTGVEGGDESAGGGLVRYARGGSWGSFLRFLKRIDHICRVVLAFLLCRICGCGASTIGLCAIRTVF